MDDRSLSRRRFGQSVAATASVRPWRPRDARAAAAGNGPVTTTNCGFPADPASLWAGSTSAYLQPWRTMIETRSFTTLADGIGTQNSGFRDAASLPMLARHGFRHIRSAWAWNQVSYADPTTISPADPNNAEGLAYFRAVKAAGLRPLLVLQAFNQGPCPTIAATIQLAEPYRAGETTMTLTRTHGLRAGYSGPYAFWTPKSVYVADFCDPGAASSPAAFFTRFDGHVATLSRPLSVNIAAGGAGVIVHTLRYKPFAEANSPDYEATMAGWVSYVGAVSRIMQEILGTGGKADLGFDLEIWNELTFGSQFLDINNYYSPPVATLRHDATGQPAVWDDILRRTGAHVVANPDQFAGVRVVNGFTNTTPFFSASEMPAAISAMSKHAYPSLLTFPAQDEGTLLGTDGKRTDFKPDYTMFVPEAAFADVQIYGLFYDGADVTNVSSGVPRGVNSRRINGQVRPVTLWMTEVGTPTAEHGVTEREAMWHLLAKGLLRIVFFNAAVGVERSYIFKAVGDQTFFAIVGETAPSTPTLPVEALSRALSVIRGGANTTVPGPLARFHAEVTCPPGAATAVLWKGDGTPACPDFRHPDDFVLFPVQVTPKRFAFVYWFHCLDLRRDMPPVGFDLAISGLPGAVANATTHDPLADVTGAVTAAAVSGGATRFRVDGSDTPRILVVTLA